ncbi:MAG: N-acetyl-gamma-glutamyl-phosphate reductase [Gammaproteobacteria bacterium]|nr:MAG: N-acetyl-gamma-glutamyl-phosphate reductase [Gammaproteobacteria bacterium]RKZ95172.1 MAG: N-acetyl-gamma-glutamyl-phosphate reductase [Gammaproteobacteria bacterium]RKZ98466.1 MAG: N-acetyl-gamma-glutamyl-phosphate reductase [Gammaproteobacteria bacterium]RKZ99749.1 MAG: N-acetyl-gamma-glutamyl-phosphate reductase [Gammaproteobacteria bacterium]
MIKVGIVGATGYTGVELLRLLAIHPEVSLHVITSRSDGGLAVSDLFPNLRNHIDLHFSEPDVEELSACDVVFFATPHCVAMSMVPKLLARGTRIIDLSADFRLRDAKQWEQWYNMPHTCPELLAQAVYGLPEVNRKTIRTAQLIAVPGCYPTATQLGFLPLLEQGVIDPIQLIADTKSGVSGAGRKAAVGSLLAEASENMKAYAVAGHRHLPEIEQGLSDVCKQAVSLTFVPHLTPMIRGIHATLYGKLTKSVDLQQLFEQRYANEPFVDVLPAGSHPETRSVRGANVCRIAVHQPQHRDTVVVLSAIDNLVKGASGQAVQNMNIMFGLDESLAINNIATLP